MLTDRPLRFCMVTTFYPPYNFGGDGIYIHRLSNELARRGHEVEVVHCVDSFRSLTDKAVSESEYPNEDGVTVHRLRSRAGILSPLITQQTGRPGLKGRRLTALLENGRFDVINYHNVSLIGPTVLRMGDAIKIYTMHEHWLVCPMHILWKLGKEPCREKQCLRCVLHGRRPPQYWRYTGLLARCLRHVDAFIAMSRFSRDKHVEMGLDVSAPIVHIPYFVPLPDAAAAGSPGDAPHPRPYFLFVGRLEKMKGVQHLIDAFRDYPRADLLVAGDGEYGEALRRQAAGADNVHLLGRQSYDRLQSLLRHARALLVSSIGYETFGIVILEAFAQRTPVIVHDLGSLPEIARQSGGGLIYRNREELLAALDKLQDDEKLRERLGKDGYDAYVTYWTPEPHLRQYMGLIQEAADRRAAAVRDGERVEVSGMRGGS